MLPHPKNVTSLGSKVGPCGNPTSVIRDRHTLLGFGSSLPTIILLIVIIPKWLTCNMHCTYILFQCYRPRLTSLILTMRLTKAAQIFVPILHYRDDVVCLCYSTATTPVELSTVTGGSRCLGWLSS